MGEPVSGFQISFKWHKNYWEAIFDAQIDDLIRRDIARALADDKLIVYLSCPELVDEAGGDRSTNVEIARSTERRLLNQWGERFWILNPAQYQMESEEGQSLMQRHAIALGVRSGRTAESVIKRTRACSFWWRLHANVDKES